ncbi:MAG: hypothetical protein U0263_39080 [Polyangiaceae bacterium]
MGGARGGDIRDEDGVRYLNVDLLRRGLGRLALAVLVKEPLWPLFALSRPLGGRALPASGGDRRPARQLEALRRVALALPPCRWWRRPASSWVSRRWLIEGDGMLADGATGEHVPEVHRRLKKILGRRAKSLARKPRRRASAGERGAADPRDFAAQPAARGATGLERGVRRDRHLFAGFPTDLGFSWVSDPSMREASNKVWDEEGLNPAPARAGPCAQGRAAAGDVATRLELAGRGPGAGQCSGSGDGPYRDRGEPAPGSIVVIPDGRPDSPTR